MAQQITKENLAVLMEAVSSNFKFKLNEGFELIFNMIFEQIKHLDRSVVQKKFEQLLLTSNEQWNQKYGFAGYPSLSDWIKIIAGERPATDEDKAEELKQYEDRMNYFAGYIIAWLHQPSILEYRYFLEKYKNPDNKHLKTIIDDFAKIKEDIHDDRIIKLAAFLKSQYDADKNGFKEKLRNIAKEQNPAPLIEFKPKQQNLIPLPTFKKI